MLGFPRNFLLDVQVNHSEYLFFLHIQRLAGELLKAGLSTLEFDAQSGQFDVIKADLESLSIGLLWAL